MKPGFHGDLCFIDKGGFPFMLKESLIYKSVILPLTIGIPGGFYTDLASIPRVLWNVLPPIGKYDPAAVLHDYAYQKPHWIRVDPPLTRLEADGLLLEAMEVCKVGWWTRHTIWLGVRFGGWVTWNRYRRAEARTAAL